jgi:hypothetical protein
VVGGGLVGSCAVVEGVVVVVDGGVPLSDPPLQPAMSVMRRRVEQFLAALRNRPCNAITPSWARRATHL